MFADRDFLDDSDSSASFEGDEDQFATGSKFQPADIDQDFEAPDYSPPQQYSQQYSQQYEQPRSQYAPPQKGYSDTYAQEYAEPRRQYVDPFSRDVEDRQPRVQTPPRTAYDEPLYAKPLKKAENEKIGFTRFDEPEVKPTTASARPGSSSAAMRAKMLEKQRSQYSSKKETFQVTSSNTNPMTRPLPAEVDIQPTGKEFRSRPFASHIYEPGGGFKPESALAPVKAERTVFGVEEIEEVQLDESKATKHDASKAVQNLRRPVEEPVVEPPKQLITVVEEPQEVRHVRAQAESQPPEVDSSPPVVEETKRPPEPPVESQQPDVLPPPESNRKDPAGQIEVTRRPPPEEPPRRPLVNVQQILADAMQDMHRFLTRSLPREVALQCTIRRERGGFNRLYPKYFLYISDTRTFLLAGKKRPGNKTSNYLMSMSDKDLKTKSPSYLGKVRSNFMGTEFTIYDKGLNPKKKQATMETFREELGVITYQSNLLGAKGPRKMRVLLPAINAEGERYRWKPANVISTQKEMSIIAKYKSGDLTGMFDLFNKPPKWNERRLYSDVQAFVLNFNGRVDKASVKNFQLIDNEDESRIYLQFGRVGDNEFTLDFQWPFSPLQAFAVALSSFDNKLACE